MQCQLKQMKTRKQLKLSLFAVAMLGFFVPETSAKHLFLLSGQSNMARFQPESTFAPAIEAEFGAENFIVVKEAQGGQPISRWYKEWVSPEGEKPETTGELYDQLMEKVTLAIAGQEITTITFIWMQGEADAKAGDAEVYLDSLHGLKAQLENDLGRSDINYVIGRLSDNGFFKRGNPVENPQWEMMRNAQMAFADASAKAVWIDTDDLNGENNELHYIKPEGYDILGERYAEKAIDLINNTDHDDPAIINHFTSAAFDGPMAIVDTPYAETIAGWAVGPDPDLLTYTKLTGPDWLNIETNGVLSGIPENTDTGTNSWTVQVSDGYGGFDEAELSISVFERLLLDFGALEDTYSAEGSPDSNFGTSTKIELRTPTAETNLVRKIGFLKFDIAIPSPLISATLSVYRGNHTLSGGVAVHEVKDHSWAETNLTWNNQPVIESNALAQATSTTDWAHFDLSDHLTESGTYSFALIRGKKDSSREAKSKEYGTPAILQLELEPPAPGSYLEWVSATVSNVLEWGYADDPDGNGLNNLFEYSAGNLPDCHFNGDSYSYTYNRRRDAGSRGLTYQLERSDNLVSNVWETIEFSGSTEILNESFEAVTQTGSISSLSQEFIRLKIELDE